MKDRQFSLLNLLGMSTGLACALLIWLWVADERSVDKYNEKDGQLYQVMANLKTDGAIKTMEYTPGILAKALKDQFPEIQYSVSMLPASWFSGKGVIADGETHIKAGGQYVSKDYFDVFTCPFIEGDRSRVLSDKASVAISEDLATKLFNTPGNALGKTIHWDQGDFSGPYVVTGVFKANPSNATDQFDVLFNYDLLLEKRPYLLKWGNDDPSTYIIVKKGADIHRLNNEIHDFILKRDKDAGVSLFLIRFSDRYLYSNYENGVQAGGRIAYVKLFSIIAVFLLLIACINFMNLSTARAARRSKEVGIKKAVGASRGILVLQYLGESVLMAISALILALILVKVFLPVFNEITTKQLELHFDAGMIVSVLGITLFTGLVAGSYPAFYLSGFKPAAVLKGKVKTSLAEVWVRKGLVVFQFTLSIAFIAAILVIYKQVAFIQSKNLGYNRDHLLHFEVSNISDTDTVGLNASASFINELRNTPGIVSVSSYYHNLTGGHGGTSGLDWPGKKPGANIEFANLEVGYDFTQTAGIKMKEGRAFSDDAAAQNEIVFNETAIKTMGLKDPIGKTISLWGEKRQIVGVAADFNFESLYQNIKPCFFQVLPGMPNVLVRIKAGAEKPVIAQIGRIYSSFYPGLAFDYRFLDSDFQLLYASEARVEILSRYFAGMAILISCLGLFGLAVFTAQRRQKEIGIRKVLGASVSGVTFLLSKEFLQLVLVAIVIAFPLVWYALHSWLQAFAYHVDIKADSFLITGLAAIGITVLTVSFQSVKAALRNPVESLRVE